MGGASRRRKEKAHRVADPDYEGYVRGVVQRAVACHRAGNLPEAERLCRKALDPQFGVLHLLGVIRAESGDFPGALEFLRTAIRINPRNAQAFNNLGNVYREENRPDEAVRCYRRALELKPRFVAAYHNLGVTLADQGQLEEALACYRRVLELAPADESVRHKVAALSGQPTPAAPKEYILELFEPYAEQFESHLQSLRYDTPRRLMELFERSLAQRTSFELGVDIGCGTGLSGAALRPVVNELWGVDISPRMIEKAREKGVYDRLMVADLGDFLRQLDRPLDVSICTEVFIYIGDLDPVFGLLSARTRPGGYFLFSTECHDGEGYVLRPSARYAQADAYVRRMLERHGFTLMAHKSIPLRVDREGSLPGSLFVARLAQSPAA